MSEEVVGSGPLTQVTHDDMTVVSNSESAEDMSANFKTEPRPKDGEPEDPKVKEEKERKAAAVKLGKAGGEAAAKARSERETADEVPETPEGEEKLGKPRHDARARVMEATRKLAEERKARQALEDRLARLEAERGQPAKEATSKPSGDGKPQPDQFESYEEFVEALADWKTDRKVEKLTREAEERQANVSHAQGILQRVDGFRERIEKVAEADPEFTDKVDGRLLEITPTFMLHPNQAPSAASDVAQAIIESDNSGALLLHLSEHPEDMSRIIRLPDSFAVFRAIGALEARLTSEPAPKVEAKRPEPSVSKAAPPVRPVHGTPSYSEEDVDEDTDLDTHIRILNAREERTRRGRA